MTIVEFYMHNQSIFSSITEWGTIFIATLSGIITRNLFDSDANLTNGQTLIGAVFITLLVHFFKVIASHKESIHGIALIVGVGAKDLIQKIISEKLWSKYFRIDENHDI